MRHSSDAAIDDPGYREAVQRQVEKLLRRVPYHSLRLPDGTVIPGLIGIEALERRLAAFPIPSSLAGRRVLDVGAASGWNSFAMAARGATVTAVDCVEFEEFGAVQPLIKADVDYRILDVDELSPATVGHFDYVLFLGVLYHLRHPLLALEKICALTKEAAFVESFVSDPLDRTSDACSMEFYETDDLGGQIDNWYGPTARCLLALCRSAGFVRVQLEYVHERRAGVTCFRRWEGEPEYPAADSAWLYSAVNNRTNDIFFHPGKDEYLCVYFRSSEPDLTRADMRIEVDGYGVNALTLAPRRDDEWQANTHLPPGIEAGEHWVRLRTASSRFGNAFRIVMAEKDGAVTTPSSATAKPAPAPVIDGIENSLDRSLVFHGYRTERLCCRFGGRPDLHRESIEAVIDSRPLAVSFLTNLGNGLWEANIALPEDLAPGIQHLRLRIGGGEWSDAAEFMFECG